MKKIIILILVEIFVPIFLAVLFYYFRSFYQLPGELQNALTALGATSRLRWYGSALLVVGFINSIIMVILILLRKNREGAKRWLIYSIITMIIGLLFVVILEPVCCLPVEPTF